MKKIFLFMFLMFIFASNVSAEACDAYDIKRLKEIADGVEITYELQEPYDNGFGVVNDGYKIKVSGLTDEIVLINKTEEVGYNIDTNFDELIFFGGKRTFVIDSVYCGDTLKKFNLKLPAYNIFSLYSECSEKRNSQLYVCQKWIDNKITKEEFYKVIKNLEIGKEGGFFNKKIFFIVASVVFLAFFIILFVKNRRDVLR